MRFVLDLNMSFEEISSVRSSDDTSNKKFYSIVGHKLDEKHQSKLWKYFGYLADLDGKPINDNFDYCLVCYKIHQELDTIDCVQLENVQKYKVSTSSTHKFDHLVKHHDFKKSIFENDHHDNHYNDELFKKITDDPSTNKKNQYKAIDQKKFETLLTIFFVCTKQSFKSIEHWTFVQLINAINPSLKIPDKFRLSTKLLFDLYSFRF